MHTSIYAYNANWGASSKNRSKTIRKSLRNRPQNGPKSVPNRSKIGFGTDLAANIDFGPSWNRFRTVLGPLLAASGGSSWGQVGPKIDFWRSWMAFKTEHDAGYLSEPLFGRFWSDFGIQNRFKIGPEAVSRAIMT